MNTSIIELEERNPDLTPHQIRESGNIPVTIYSKHLDKSLSLQINDRSFRNVKNSKFIHAIQANIPNLGNCSLLIKDIDKYPIGDKILHIQFQHLKEGDKVKIQIPVLYTDESPHVKAGASLYIYRKSVRLLCEYKNTIPSNLEHSLNVLQGDVFSISYADLKLPEACSLIDNPEQIVAKISTKGATTEETTEEEAK